MKTKLRTALLAAAGFWIGVAGFLALAQLCSLLSGCSPSPSPARAQDAEAETRIDPRVPCYEILSVRPEQGVLILFDACTGNIEVRRYVAPPPSHPAPEPSPAPGSADSAFLGSSAPRPAPKLSI
jgi:hypothetical protein